MGDGEKLHTHLNSALKVLLGLDIFPRVTKKMLNFVDQCYLHADSADNKLNFSNIYSRNPIHHIGVADDLQGIFCAQFSRTFLKISSEVQCSCPLVINILQKAIINLSTLHSTYIELRPK